MATATIFSSLRRRRLPSPDAFLAPVDLSNTALVQTLAVLSADLISSYSGKSFAFQSKNARSLIRRIEVFVMLLEFLRNSTSALSSTAVLCLKELYLVLYRSKMLLDYCSQSSRIWLLLQNHSVSGYFHDLSQEISTLLDVLPLQDFDLGDDVTEQMDLLRRQSSRSKLLVEECVEALRLKFFLYLDELERGHIPDQTSIRSLFMDGLGIRDAKTCLIEIEYLEDQISNHHEDLEQVASILNGFVALTRYCRFLLFGFEEDNSSPGGLKRVLCRSLVTQEIADTFITIPPDFCCPIHLDLMKDPVIISSGQTYDRCSITRWFEEGHCTCPKTGQILTHTNLVPNKALSNLIMQWCAANTANTNTNTDIVLFDPYEFPDPDPFGSSVPSKATVNANRATASLLIAHLAGGSSPHSKVAAAREIRLLAKTGNENRISIAEAGAIPRLAMLLASENAALQENSVTAMLNLSIHDKNKRLIMEEKNCLESIVSVLRNGLTTEARENAAATLFSLSAVHEYKKMIADEDGAVEALCSLLERGTRRGKKDAVTALFNLCTHSLNCSRIVGSAGAVGALVGALAVEGVGEEAAGTVALIVRQAIGAEAVGKEEMAVGGLMGVMRCGSPRGKENAVAALLELCRGGGTEAAERVIRAPALGGLLQSLLFTGTKRARRKAASLARVFQRCENAYYSVPNRGSNFSGGDVPMVPLSISVL